MSQLQQRVEKIIAVLENKKASDPEAIYLDGKEYIADAVVVVTSLNDRHGDALLNEMKTELKPGEEFIHTDDESPSWIVVDMGDIIVHIMTQTEREKYTIESFLEDLKSGKLD